MKTGKQRNAIHGWLILDKPKGLSSTQALGRVKWLLNAAKAGHGGTLDPFATGVLPIAFGEATKLLSYVLDGSKSYAFTATWGEARNTDDCTGEVIATTSTRPTAEGIKNILPQFTGSITQIPPQFSALHVNGERAYDLARAGETVELQPRTVTLNRFDYLGSPDESSADFEVDCSKGTYIRSLARDMGRALGSYGHVKSLKRLSCGPFTLKQAISLEKLEEIVQEEGGLERFQTIVKTIVMPIGTVLDDIPALAINEAEIRRLRQGQEVIVHPARITQALAKADIVSVTYSGNMVALAKLDGAALQPIRVFQNQP